MLTRPTSIQIPTPQPTAATPWTAVAFLQNLVRNHQEAWREKIFRFSPEEFFKRLVPVLDPPDSFTVDGYVPKAHVGMDDRCEPCWQG